MPFIDRATLGLNASITLLDPTDFIIDRHEDFVTISDKNTGNFRVTFHDDMLPMLKRVVALMEGGDQ